MDNKKLAIAIPASVISDTPHLREKTSKIGLIGRAAAIFRIDEIIVYQDNPKANQAKDADLIVLLLNYLETPQYLRKQRFKLESNLQFAGILQPLRTPHHPLSGNTRDLKAGEYREGVILSKDKEAFLVDIGIEQSAVLRETQYSIGDRLTLQIVNVGSRIEVQAASREDLPLYWGFKVRGEKRSFGQVLAEKSFDLKIATAKTGDKFMDIAIEMERKWLNSQHILVAFGAPSRGLHEIAKEEGLKLEEMVDFIVNTIPGQGTATVRTEEALLASLAVFNAQFNR